MRFGSSAVVLVLSTLAAGCKSEGNLFEQINTDSFAQAPSNEVDILWVIDNSNSMTEEQATLRSGFSLFADQLDESGTDFHLGVISTSFDYDDPTRGVLVGDPPYLTPEDDYVSAFTQRATLGIDGSDKEKGLEAALYALQPTMTFEGGPNAGFVRPDAQLLVVFVSDEEDCSDSGVLEGQGADACYRDEDLLPPISKYVKGLEDLKKDKSYVQVGAIVGTVGSTCQAVPGTRYINVAALTGGLVGDICQTQWDAILSDLGLNATGVRSQFQLSAAAVPETIQVWVDEEEWQEDPVNGWTYDEATWFLSFHDRLPPRGSVISVQYTVRPGVSEPQVEPTTTESSDATQ